MYASIGQSCRQVLLVAALCFVISLLWQAWSQSPQHSACACGMLQASICSLHTLAPSLFGMPSWLKELNSFRSASIDVVGCKQVHADPPPSEQLQEQVASAPEAASPQLPTILEGSSGSEEGDATRSFGSPVGNAKPFAESHSDGSQPSVGEADSLIGSAVKPAGRSKPHIARCCESAASPAPIQLLL